MEDLGKVVGTMLAYMDDVSDKISSLSSRIDLLEGLFVVLIVVQLFTIYWVFKKK